MVKKANFSWLLIALMGFLLVLPIAEDVGFMSARITRVVMFSWLLAIGVWSLRGFGFFFRIGIGFAIAGIVLNILVANTTSDIWSFGSFFALLGFLATAMWCIGHKVVIGRRITTNRIVGTINLYLMFGVLWATVYAFIERMIPGSFAGLSRPIVQGWSGEWLYFSFVTMSTLGYGDLVPVSATARTFAYLQAIFGQFYIAILVAGLVSAYITERLRAEQDGR